MTTDQILITKVRYVSVTLVIAGHVNGHQRRACSGTIHVLATAYTVRSNMANLMAESERQKAPRVLVYSTYSPARSARATPTVQYSTFIIFADYLITVPGTTRRSGECCGLPALLRIFPGEIGDHMAAHIMDCTRAHRCCVR